MTTRPTVSITSAHSARISSSVAVLTALLFLVTGTLSSRGGDNRAPDVPDAIEVPQGNKVLFHAYAVGVQIYVWTITDDGGSWVFRAPDAVLFDADGNEVGSHYGGPTWESNSGSTVVAARVDGVTVDPSAIPWLLLKTTHAEGPGIFKRTTYIQRVNTEGGVAPNEPGSFEGEEVQVPYTAEYFFYRAK